MLPDSGDGHVLAAALHAVATVILTAKRCVRSHALLPDFVVPFHRDTTDVIFAALDRRVVLDVPGSTRRGWQARFNRNTETVRSAIAAAAVGFGGQVRDMRIDRLLMALWRAVRRASDMIASPSTSPIVPSTAMTSP